MPVQLGPEEARTFSWTDPEKTKARITVHLNLHSENSFKTIYKIEVDPDNSEFS